MELQNRTRYNWSLQEKEKLVQQAQIYKRRGDIIDWQQVQKLFPNLTLSQLQTQLNNTVKQKQIKFEKKNHIWTEKEQLLLFNLYNQSQGDWKKILRKFPNLSQSQLKNKIQRLKKQFSTQCINAQNFQPQDDILSYIIKDTHSGELDQQTADYIQEMVK